MQFVAFDCTQKWLHINVKKYIYFDTCKSKLLYKIRVRESEVDVKKLTKNYSRQIKFCSITLPHKNTVLLKETVFFLNLPNG